MQRQRRALAAMSKYSRTNVCKSVSVSSVSSQCLTCRQSVSIAPVPYVICDQLVLINTENDRSPRALIILLVYCTYCTKLQMFHDIPMPEAKFQPRRVGRLLCGRVRFQADSLQVPRCTARQVSREATLQCNWKQHESRLNQRHLDAGLGVAR